MTEPTHKQHLVLVMTRDMGGSIIKSEDAKHLETYWELVRAGYLKNLVVLSGGWEFILTEDAEKYLTEFLLKP